MGYTSNVSNQQDNPFILISWDNMNLIVDSVCVECCESGSAEVRTLMHESKLSKFILFVEL